MQFKVNGMIKGIVNIKDENSSSTKDWLKLVE